MSVYSCSVHRACQRTSSEDRHSVGRSTSGWHKAIWNIWTRVLNSKFYVLYKDTNTEIYTICMHTYKFVLL